MKILALTPVALVDATGPKARYNNEIAQFQTIFIQPEELQDLGKVFYEGQEFYASLYTPPKPPE